MSVFDFLRTLSGRSINPNHNNIINAVENFRNNINDPYFSCSNAHIQTILKISWEEEFDGLSEETIFYAISLYFLDAINFETFRSFVLYCIRNGLLSNSQAISIYIVEKLKQQDENYSYFEYIDFARELGVLPVLFSEFEKCIKFYDNSIIFDEKERNKASILERTVLSFRERKQYLEEFANSVEPSILNYLDAFIDQELLEQLSYLLSKHVSKRISFDKEISIAEFQSLFEEELKKQQLPFLPVQLDPILQPHLGKIKAKPVSMEELANISPKLVKEFASVKAYSSPKLAQKVRITFLGGGGIGNMAILIQHNNGAILLDSGMNVANYAIPKWHPALKFVKAILITHAHLDHTGALPYFITPESGKRWYASPQTKKLTELLLFDTSSIIDEINVPSEHMPPFYSAYLKRSNLINLFNVFEPIHPKKPIEVAPGFEVTAYPSSHLFGSYGYEIEIYGYRILFTGDFSLNNSALFKGAKMPTDCDVTIFDGTYYNRETTAQDLSLVLSQAGEQCKRIIIPAFSLGRSQEMFKRVEQAGLDKKFKVKIVGLSSKVTSLMGISGNYRGYNSLQSDEFEEGDLVIAGNGMLQGGTARVLLDATKDDEDTGVILCGYQAPNTLGFALKTDHPIALQNYHQKVYNAKVSGHSTAFELDKFIAKLSGKKIMVHTPKSTKTKSKHKDLLIPKYMETIELTRKISKKALTLQG